METHRSDTGTTIDRVPRFLRMNAAINVEERVALGQNREWMQAMVDDAKAAIARIESGGEHYPKAVETPVAPMPVMSAAETARIKTMGRREEARMGRILRRAARSGQF